MTRVYEPTPEQVVAYVEKWDDGVSAAHLVARMVSDGYENRWTQRRIQSLLDRGIIKLGAGLRLWVA
jgi:hypothetical protein